MADVRRADTQLANELMNVAIAQSLPSFILPPWLGGGTVSVPNPNPLAIVGAAAGAVNAVAFDTFIRDIGHRDPSGTSYVYPPPLSVNDYYDFKAANDDINAFYKKYGPTDLTFHPLNGPNDASMGAPRKCSH